VGWGVQQGFRRLCPEVRTVTKRLACPPAPGPLEDYAAQFDALFTRLAQRRGLRAYLQGLLLPRDRNKTTTALAGAKPVVGAQHAAVQGLQWFVTESSWDHQQVNQRRVELLVADPATSPHDQGALVIDDSGDRKAGRHTAHVARQWLGSLGARRRAARNSSSCGCTWIVRPPLAVVQRPRSGQRWQWRTKLTRPELVIGAVAPAGHLAVPASRSIWKSWMVNPPGTALCSGIGLIVWVCPAARRAARVCPDP
jgi:DDE superfamily endonuclease